MQLFFKSGNGIKQPKDAFGVEIKEGDVLTFECWKDKNIDFDFYLQFYPKITLEELWERVNKPTIIVRYNKEENFFYGEGLSFGELCGRKCNRLYMHDFRFKTTKRICHISEKPELWQE